MSSDPHIEAFLDRVHRRLRHHTAERRQQELDELRSHIGTLVRDRLLRGASQDHAVEGALLAFGSADVLGRALARTGPRPNRLPRFLLAGLTFSLAVGATVAQAFSAPWDAVDAVMKVANTFVRHAMVGDANAASELFSLPERWFDANPDTLGVMFKERQDVFTNFESLEREKYNATVQFNLRALINGKVTLKDGKLVPFKASFINIAGTWKLQSFELK